MNLQEIISGLTMQDHGEHDTAITINHGDFKGVTFKFGRTWFPDPEQPILSFEYDLISEAIPSDKAQPEFRLLLGNILSNMLIKAIETEGVVYTGGREVQEVIEGDGGEYLDVKPIPRIISDTASKSKILLPEDYKVPEPEYGTRMSRNLLSGL
jgi:hypothetical protein